MVRASPTDACGAQSFSSLSGRNHAHLTGCSPNAQDRAGANRDRRPYKRSYEIDAPAVDTDIFQFRGMIMRFHRDKDCKVTAFDYSNPVVRNIAFIRLSDQAARR